MRDRARRARDAVGIVEIEPRDRITRDRGDIIQTIDAQQATEIAESLGLRRKGAAKRKSKRRNGKSCEDCFFHRRLLCALDLDEPCSTFRPEGPQGLVPPRQPALLMRDN